ACGEFDQLAKVAVTDGSYETQRREVNREFCFFQNVRDREVVRNAAAPALAHVESRKSGATNCGRAAPAKVFYGVTAECRGDRSVPNTAKTRRDTAAFGNEPAIASRCAQRLVCERRDEFPQPV